MIAREEIYSDILVSTINAKEKLIIVSAKFQFTTVQAQLRVHSQSHLAILGDIEGYEPNADEPSFKIIWYDHVLI